MRLNNLSNTIVSKRKIVLLIFLSIVAFFIFTAFVYAHSQSQPPATFPSGLSITIAAGSSTAEVAEHLKQMNVVKSKNFLNFILKTRFYDTYIQAGTYQFAEPMNSSDIAYAITRGEHLAPPTAITFPEGLRGEKMVPIIRTYLPWITDVKAETLDEHIGYLFPDTYFVSDNVDLASLITVMKRNFDAKTEHLNFALNPQGLSKEEVVILASIVEREASTIDSKKKIAGILLSRLAMGMPLQVDATFDFLHGKASSEITMNDLQSDSPYNTYVHTGLPPTPISNPSAESIEAVIDPEKTPYLYYLTGLDGNFYYADTFETHKRNKALYLR